MDGKIELLIEELEKERVPNYKALRTLFLDKAEAVKHKS